MEEKKLEILKFSICSKEDKNSKINMSSIDGIDLIDNFFSNFIPFIEKLEPDKKNKRVVKIGDSYTKHDNIRSISGILETGKYGKEENVVDVNSKVDIPVFKIHKNHSVPKPFFFLVCIPQLKNDGLIILERDGQFGIKSIFMLLFHKFIELNFVDFKVKFDNFIDDKIVENYIRNGSYNSISLTRNYLPADISERYGLGKFETDDFVIELTIRAKGKKIIKGNAKKRVLELFESAPDGFFSSEDFSNLGFDENATVKVNANYQNSTRTIDLSDTMKFKPYYNVMVELNDSGHSDFKSIEAEAIRLLKDFNLDLF